MSILKEDDSKKWIQTLLVIVSGVFAYVMFAFIGQLTEWFDLEAKVKGIHAIAQIVALLSGGILFYVVATNTSTKEYLDEVYRELVKVTWPDYEGTLKLTFGVVIGIIITGIILGIVDFCIGKLMRLLY
jgi:preprotein translocase subunit SecE